MSGGEGRLVQGEVGARQHAENALWGGEAGYLLAGKSPEKPGYLPDAGQGEGKGRPT